jgi:hypothetical protein
MRKMMEAEIMMMIRTREYIAFSTYTFYGIEVYSKAYIPLKKDF